MPLLLLISAFPSSAQEDPEALLRIDSVLQTKNTKTLFLPFAFFSPETNFGIGAGAQLLFLKLDDTLSSRSSSILGSFVYTLNDQVLIEFTPSLYFGRGKYYVEGILKYQVFPNSFWGIGNETPDRNEERYSMNTFSFRGTILRRYANHFNYGVSYIFEGNDVTRVAQGGILDTAAVLGSNEARISALALVFNKDSRDFVETPTRGSLVQFIALASDQNFGANVNFAKIILDARVYLSLSQKSVIALQAFSENSFGDVPFQSLARYGGSVNGRGYFQGRYRDLNQLVFQAEWRYRFHPRWTWAGFALVGDVFNSDSGSGFLTLKPSFGSGVRFRFVKNQNTWLRLDMGIGRNGNSGLYFGVNEAF